jgi:hypothetical protein
LDAGKPGRLGKERKRGQVLIYFWTQIDTDEHRLKEEEGRKEGKKGAGTYCFCVEAQLSHKKVRAGVALEVGGAGFFVFR